jgi:hypothetical protein
VPLHPVFKPEKKGDSLTCAYLHADGHVVTSWVRLVRDLDTRIHYVKVAETIGVVARFAAGRIVFHDPVALIAAASLPGDVTIRATRMAVEHGSENSKARGIAWGGVYVETDRFPLSSYCLPENEIVAGAVTVQLTPEFDAKFAETCASSSIKIAEIYRATPEASGKEAGTH